MYIFAEGEGGTPRLIKFQTTFLRACIYKYIATYLDGALERLLSGVRLRVRGKFGLRREGAVALHALKPADMAVCRHF